MADCNCGTGGLLIGGGHEHWCATFADPAQHEHDAAGCLDCPCVAAPHMNSLPCTCAPRDGG